MSKSICLVQSVKEIKFILNKLDKKIIFLPLDLSTQIYCIVNKLNFYNPINYIGKDFHQRSLIYSEKLIQELKFGNLNSESQKKEVKAVVRFRFHSIVFILELIEKLKISGKLEELIISGWDEYYEQFSEKNHFVSYLILKLIKDVKITCLKKIEHLNFSEHQTQDFIINKPKLSKNKKNIIITNLGYNFFKIILSIRKKKFTIITPEFEKINFLKKIIYMMLGVKFAKLNKKFKKKNNFVESPTINFSYKDKDLSEVLNFRLNQEKNNFEKLKNQSDAIDNFFKKVEIKTVITNLTKGVYGYFVDSAETNKVRSICIPHGTLSESFNEYDKIYKETIAEAITNHNSTIHASQSVISNKFYEQQKSKFKKVVKFGNLIFNCDKKSKNKNKKILYAVTMKDFESIQLLGVEMYYEFLDNLFFLQNFSKKNNIKFIIKLHPINYKNLNDLEKIFKNLEFSIAKIRNSFDKVFATISFSSTAIEDSLNSKCPVILLDRWKRYEHCKAEKNENKKNMPIYYVSNETSLKNCINTVSNSNSINFENYVSKNLSKNNIEELVSNYL